MNDIPVPDVIKQMLQLAAGQRALLNGEASQMAVNPAPPEAPEAKTPEEITSECALQTENDLGNAKRLLLRYGEKILHITNVGWHGYNGQHWKEDEGSQVVRPMAQRTAHKIYDEAHLISANEDEQSAIEEMIEAKPKLKKMGRPKAGWTDDENREYGRLLDVIEKGEDTLKAINRLKSGRYNFAKQAGNSGKISGMLTEAAPHVSRAVNDMDMEPYAINLKNGTLRFLRVEDKDSDRFDPTYKWKVRLDKHNPKDYISKLADATFDPKAKCTEFNTFIHDAQPSPENRAFLQRFFGYCLLGTAKEQVMLFCLGPGGDGKSTFVNTICDILGSYGSTLSVNSFTGDNHSGGGDATPDMARLPGARLVSIAEPERGTTLKEGLIKTVTGGEPIPVRRLHQDFIEVIPQFKLVMTGNTKPIIKDKSDGIWRRLLLLKWMVQKEADKRDKDLLKKLQSERDGIFNWLVAGALMYLENGLDIPAGVRAATEEYRLASDPIADFITTSCEVTGRDEDEVSPSDIWVAYRHWAYKDGYYAYSLTQMQNALPDYAERNWRDKDGNKTKFNKVKKSVVKYRGIKLDPTLSTERPDK